MQPRLASYSTVEEDLELQLYHHTTFMLCWNLTWALCTLGRIPAN